MEMDSCTWSFAIIKINMSRLCFSSLVRPALTCRDLPMETRSQQTRLDHLEDQFQILQTDVAEIKSSLAANQSTILEIQKLMMTWIKQQEKQPVYAPGDVGDSGGSVLNPHGTPPESSSGGSPLFPSNSTVGLPYAVKKVHLPEFCGFDPQGWIQKAKLFFEINGTPPNLRLRLAQLSMTGVAQHWFTIVQQVHDSLTWEQLQLELLQRFSGLEIQNLYEQLATIQQTSSIHDYIDDFEYLLSLVPRLPESQALGYFVAGLRDEVKRWVRLHRPQSRLDAMYLAKDVEEMLNPSSGNVSQFRFRYHQLGGFGDSSKVDKSPLMDPNLVRRLQLGGSANKGADTTFSSNPRQSLSTQSEASNVVQRDRGIRSLTRTEWEERCKKGLCFRCGLQFGPAHKCSEGTLRVLLLGDDEYEANGGNVYQHEELGLPEHYMRDIKSPGSGAS